MFNTYKKESSLLLTTGYEKGNNKSTTSVTYNPREEVETVTWNTNNSLSSIGYTRDFLRRIKASSYNVNNNTILNTTYNYIEYDKDESIEGNDTTTNVLSNVQNTYNNTTDTYSYTFDDLGNISSITKKVNETTSYTNTYVYDSLNQLIRENNQELNKTYTFSYDNGGNLLEAKTYSYTTEAITGNPISTESYTYGDSSWKDLLTSYNGNPITYDNIGNPLSYHDGKQFTWSFRRLEQIVDGSNTYTYTYNQDGIRTSKTVNGVSTNYIVSGNRILEETTGTNTIIYEYDALGNASSFVYNGNRYIYVRNGTNDIVGILNSSGALVTTYKYDGWGNVEVINHTTDTIGTINPIRYRSYYYDVETGYYYLNSRYYDSNVGRFINSDEISNLGVNNDVQSLNVYAYCANNPIHRYDNDGNFWWEVATVALGAFASFSSQVMINVMTGEPWYKSVIGATISGGLSVAIGGLGGILISNAIGVFVNGIQANNSDYEYTEQEALSDFVSGVFMDISIGRILGTGVDKNNKIIIIKDTTSKIENNIFDNVSFKYDVLEEQAKRGIQILPIVAERLVSTPTSVVNYYAGKATSFVKSKPSTPATLFKQPAFGFHS